MHTHTTNPNGEKGNAVALTLLGLAVAILAGVGVLYMIGNNTPYSTSQGNGDERPPEPPQQVESIDPRAAWSLYDNSDFDFSFRYPPGWIVATGTVRGVPVVTAYDARQNGSVDSPDDVDMHTSELRVTIYPQGLPGGGEGEQTVPSYTVVPVPQSHVTDAVLASGVPWATTATFDVYPESWESYGFIYGRVPVEQESLSYMRGDTPIAAQDFDPYGGDTVVIEGYTDAVLWETVSLIVNSFTFSNLPRIGEASELAPITVASPLSGSSISSPLLVEGEARGPWYFEASFPVRLETNDGVVLAEVPATAQGDWMTEDYVPFSVSIVFTMPESATSGILILQRDNPSGLPENDEQIEIPILFNTVSQ